MVERVFTADIGKRFKKGDARDYPAEVWGQISKSAKKPLAKFTKLVTMVETAEPVEAAQPADNATI